MRSYRLKEGERGPFTELFIATRQDFAVGFNNQTVKFTRLNDGDTIFAPLLRERRVDPVGLTTSAVVSLGYAGTADRFHTAEFNANPWLAQPAAFEPLASNGIVDLILTLAGGSAAPTAGELWFWLCISRASDRAKQA